MAGIVISLKETKPVSDDILIIRKLQSPIMKYSYQEIFLDQTENSLMLKYGKSINHPDTMANP